MFLNTMTSKMVLSWLSSCSRGNTDLHVIENIFLNKVKWAKRENERSKKNEQSEKNEGCQENERNEENERYDIIKNFNDGFWKFPW